MLFPAARDDGGELRAHRHPNEPGEPVANEALPADPANGAHKWPGSRRWLTAVRLAWFGGPAGLTLGMVGASWSAA